MQWLRDYRFKWRVRRARLALQTAGYITLPFDGSSILAFHWADPQNRILFQPSRTPAHVGQMSRSSSRTDVRLGQVSRYSSRSVVRLGQVTCYPGRPDDDEPESGAVPLATRTVWEWPVTIGGWQYVNTVGELRAVALVHASRVRTDY